MYIRMMSINSLSAERPFLVHTRTDLSFGVALYETPYFVVRLEAGGV